MAEQLLRPGDVARDLEIAANTLRVYSTRFGPVLTPSAARPAAGGGGGSGHRLYSARDVAVLRRARDLVGAGATYEEALDQLRGEYGVPAAASGRDGELAAHLATLQGAVDAWRALAEERTRELAEVRARLADREAQLDAERRRWAEIGQIRPVTRSTESRPERQASVAERSESESEGGADGARHRRSPTAPRRAAGGRDDRPGSWLSRIFPSEPEE